MKSSTASQAYAIGDYLVYNGQLYAVTAAIAIGETLTVGTNISSTTVGTELTALNAGLMDVNSYSTTETAIGTWFDGRTIYRKFVDISRTVDISNSTWTAISEFPISTYKMVIKAIGFSTTLTSWPLLAACDLAPSVRFLIARAGGGGGTRYFCIDYLKD